jgi:hypothetical protein
VTIRRGRRAAFCSDGDFMGKFTGIYAALNLAWPSFPRKRESICA